MATTMGSLSNIEASQQKRKTAKGKRPGNIREYAAACGSKIAGDARRSPDAFPEHGDDNGPATKHRSEPTKKKDSEGKEAGEH
ncbi:hypothetical protein [Paenibacillus sp. DYY-L-2]|uniref:hypothetical protein n=1 Tax=Paenibacillus sp. DYY-L-2 TaxID=3447013 RepID=UPI003F50677F